MLSHEERAQIRALIEREVVPATGCTEPAAVALCVAAAARTLTAEPERVTVSLSANMLKNAMGVGIPGTGGMTGLPIAIALGAVMGRPERLLEVLSDISDRDMERARQMIADGRIEITLCDPAPDILYIEATATDPAGHIATAVIQGAHTRFVSLERDGEQLPLPTGSATAGTTEQDSTAAPSLSMARVWDYAMETPIGELDYILRSRDLNVEVARAGATAQYGHSVGRTILTAGQRFFPTDSIFARVLSATACACDARMGGAPLPVMSNSGSGNQGIAASMPVVIYARECGATEEQLVRALILSHLTVIYIKQHLGRLSALCGCVIAATGSGCGICYLMGGGLPEVSATAKNMVANLTGMICDGAKPGCAMKLASGVSTAMLSAMMAIEGHAVTAIEGIVDNDVDTTIRNLTLIGRDGMKQTDRLILQIMTHKEG